MRDEWFEMKTSFLFLASTRGLLKETKDASDYRDGKLCILS